MPNTCAPKFAEFCEIEETVTPVSLFSLHGKTAFITGGAMGIGRMATEALVRAGASVLNASRKGEACKAAEQALDALVASGQADGFASDVGARDGIAMLCEEVKERVQSIDILVNNAGTTWGAHLGQFLYDVWEKHISVNAAGMFELTQRLLPMLKKSAFVDDPVRIIDVGLVLGEVPMGNGAYVTGAVIPVPGRINAKSALGIFEKSLITSGLQDAVKV